MKYLSCPDFHYSPKWGDVSELAGRAIRQASIDNKVDFIAFPGDLYDAPIMVTDKGGINQLRKIIKSLLEVCPVVAIQGTPSHDGPGCYGPLQDLGLVLLEPGKVYGLQDGKISTKFTNPDGILFGIPEVTKQNIQATLSTSAENANAEATKLLADYVLEYIAPMRLKYKDVPAVALLHGNVSDSHQDNESDIILKASDIVIHTEDLLPAGVDRWSLGHIHTPWESHIINGGYAGFTGIDSNPWGKRGFVPAMNMIEVGKPLVRVPYGTPKRLKVGNMDNMNLYTDVAYWLDTKDPTATLPSGIHPWSRITYNETKEQTRRVTQEEAESAKTLGDLLRLLDPSATTEQVEAINSIPTSSHKSDTRVDLAMTYLKVQGCTFFREQTVEFDLSNLSEGVTAIKGGNGSGKSSLLAFCSPYPLVIGKDTSSGRISAIKDFFSGKDSLIEKRFLVNNQEHIHLITIKAAHTQNPKTECYLTIDGNPQLDKGSFDEMMTECERIYGPYNDYLLTSFYVQPLQGKSGSSLMSASMTDIRNLVQNIAGIDRSQEQRYSLDTLAKHKAEETRLNNWIEGAGAFADDIEELEAKVSESEDSIKEHEQAVSDTLYQGQMNSNKLSEVNARKIDSDSEQTRKDTDLSKISKLKFEQESKHGKIEQLKESVLEIAIIKEKLSKQDRDQKVLRDIQSIDHRNLVAMREFTDKQADVKRKISDLNNSWADDINLVKRGNTKRQEDYESTCRTLTSAIKYLESEISDAKKRTENLNIPCPQCGYIDPEVKAKIEQLNIDTKDNIKELEEKKLKLANIIQPEDKPMPTKTEEQKALEATLQGMVTPTYEPVADKPSILSSYDEEQLRAKLEQAQGAGNQIAILESQITATEQEISQLESQTYSIDATLAGKVLELDQKRATLLQEWREASEKLSTAKANLANLQERIKTAQSQLEAVSKAREDSEAEGLQIALWDYVSLMLRPAKIPAFELELLLDSIDLEATRIIDPYQEGRFNFSTETQSDGGVDRFDIMIHDNEVGTSRSFMKFSAGQKAFFSDAYVKALVRQRNERSNRSYSPVIMDESDGPIEPGLVGAYYEMQRKYWKCPVLAVSHSPASHEFIENSIDIELLKGDTK